MYNTIGILGEMVVPGMLLVIVVLALLVGCIYLMSHVIARIDKKTGSKVLPPKNTPPPVAKAPAAPAAQQPLQPASQQPGSEVVAAISGAIACVMESPYVITSVTPANVSSVQPGTPAAPERRRPVWGFAGMQQNSRPF